MNQPANFSESNDPVEYDFARSWNFIIKFYDGSSMRAFLGDTLADLMVKLVSSMCEEGYNRYCRAGQATHQLILSRSREHGYLGRCYICFSPEYDSYEINGKIKTVQALQVTYQVDGNICEEFAENEIALTNRIRNLLQRLSQQPIN
ncbi:hypothetical protein NIES4103_19960 [Nostoc sp. NIES-4103]|nr:hypothetical protein NIES4103_19960 [Nostoc sp. NIES-4103]